MYQVHQDAVFLPLVLEAPAYTRGDQKIPALSASASRDPRRRVHLSLVNLDPSRVLAASASLEGQRVTSVAGRVLSGDTLDAHNTFEAPDRVQPRTFTEARLEDGRIEARLPPRSVVVLTLAGSSP